MFNFYCCSKYENIDCIVKNWYSLNKLYKKFTYTIIVPPYQIDLFKKKLKEEDIDDIELINENNFLSFVDFKKIYEKLSSNNENIRFGWYYTQVLSISYAIENAKYSPIILLDGDTIILKKIDFFNGDNSNIYFTPYERHYPYKNACEIILKYKFKKWKSATSQIYSMTPKECNFFTSKLHDFYQRKKNDTTAIWISKLILTYMIESNESKDACFSNMDLISASNIINGSTNLKYIEFLRSGVYFLLTSKQIKIAKKLGYSLLAYEAVNFKNSKTKMSNFGFIKLLTKTFILSIYNRYKFYLSF
tara:strand:- start:1300 stop:2211 length:912 start_codon:yes stop_codon:yes gene_type:complete